MRPLSLPTNKFTSWFMILNCGVLDPMLVHHSETLTCPNVSEANSKLNVIESPISLNSLGFQWLHQQLNLNHYRYLDKKCGVCTISNIKNII